MTTSSHTTPTKAPTTLPEPMGPASVRIEMLSQPRLLSGARDFISAVSKRFGFDDASCAHIALAVDEALCNVIRHGYDRRADGRIWLSVWPIEEAGKNPVGIKIVIEDEAKQVDPEKIKGRELEDVRPGGLGVYIIHQIMNHARFEKREHTGMRLVMLKTHTNASNAG